MPQMAQMTQMVVRGIGFVPRIQEVWMAMGSFRRFCQMVEARAGGVTA